MLKFPGYGFLNLNLTLPKMSEVMEYKPEAVAEPLRPSLFNGVPPFINFIPESGLHYGGHSMACGSQYWDEDQVI